MPREQVEWYVNDNTRQQTCSYYSMINNKQGTNPYINSYEHEQIWTMSKQNKRYQSSIENIHLTTPPILKILKPFLSNNKHDKLSLLPPVPPSKQFHSLSYRSNTHYYSKPILGTNSIGRKSQLNINSMRIMRINGELVVRI